jgi:GAF domain-containing protein
MAAPARKAQAKKGTARAGVKRTRLDPRASKLARAQAALRRARDEARGALERERAISEVFARMAGSASDIGPVLSAVAERAAHLCEAEQATVLMLEEAEFLRPRVTYSSDHGPLPNPATLVRLHRGYITGRAAIEGRTINVEDAAILNDSEYPQGSVNQRKLGYRSFLAVPMLREGRAIGVIAVWRRFVRKFSDKHVALVRTFADQAVIAIENARLFNETREALEQQTATGEILKVISRSTTDVQPVFDTIARNARQLLGGSSASVILVDGAEVRMAALSTVPGAEVYQVARQAYPMSLDKLARERPQFAKLLASGEPASMTDVEVDHAASASVLEFARAAGIRSNTAVPMLRDGKPIGLIVVNRREPHATTADEIRLLETFADQAVIAIENVRLFNETRESLEQQTAISEVLRVISNSPTDVKPVLDAVAGRAARICEASDALIFMREGEHIINMAHFGEIEPGAGLHVGANVPLNREMAAGRAILDGAPIHIEDMLALRPDEWQKALELRKRSQHRTMLAVPLMRENRALGAIVLRRMEMRPFTDKQIELLKVFAAQAAIAIENVRLFNETKAALEQQTATSEILKVISRSTTDALPVFETIAQNARQLLGGSSAGLLLLESAEARMVALATAPGAERYEAVRAAYPMSLEKFARERRQFMEVLETGKPAAITDIEVEHAGNSPLLAFARSAGIRSNAVVPMLREGTPLGLIVVNRLEPHATTAEEFKLLETFADQAVIAIDNVRLFNETKEALEQQTATGKILEVISRSTTDTRPVFEAIVRSAARLFDPCSAGIVVRDGDLLQFGAAAGSMVDEAMLAELRRMYPIACDPQTSVSARAIIEKEMVRCPDTEAADAPAAARDAARLGKFRCFTAVPLIKDGEGIGAIAITHPQPGYVLADKQLALLKAFADQAVIAIGNVRLFNETKEALERQTATAGILNVIASSPSDVQPVFDAIVESAIPLMGGFSATLTLLEEGKLHLRAYTSTSNAGDEQVQKYFPVPVETADMGRAVQARVPVAVLDFETDPKVSAASRDLARARGFRAVLFVPLVRNDVAIGTINVTRREPGAFTDHQVRLLKTFADQAVIAIENARLFNETKEALERQTATSEILKVISSSTTDTQPVFDAIVRSAAKLFPMVNATILMRDGELLQLRAVEGATVDDAVRRELASLYPVPFNPEVSTSARAIVERRMNICLDTEAPGVADYIRRAGRVGRFRSNTVVPLVRDDEGIGTIVITHPQPGHRLNDKQLELLRTFADQAVIAIENVRLFNETKEALDRQTATSEILKAISSSPTDTQPVFETILSRSVHLTDGSSAMLWRFEGGKLHCAAQVNCRPEDVLHHQSNPLPLGTYNPTPQAGLERRTIQVENVFAEPGYRPLIPASKPSPNAPSVLAVPLLREGELLGVISIWRRQQRAFDEKHVATITTFADQAVIAIENVRLFNETKQALERQTATSDVLRIISTSPGDVEPVLQSIAERAAVLCQAKIGFVARYDGKLLHMAAFHGAERDALETMRALYPMDPSTGGSVAARVVRSRERVEVHDVLADAEYAHKSAAEAAGFRSVLGVPLLREGEIVGAIIVVREQAGAFPANHVELLKTFADQAAIAIENARLFNETKEALEQQKASADVLVAISSSISDTKPVFDKILQSCGRLFAGRLVGINVVNDADGMVYCVAYQGPAREDFMKTFPVRPDGNSATGRAIRDRKVLHYPDVANGPDVPATARRGCEVTGIKACIFAPMVWEDKGLGTIFVGRDRVGEFSEKEVALLKTFADQAAIAIQNARLFREIQDKSRQLEEASKHKSQFLASMSHELRTPLNAILGFNEMILGGIYGDVPGDMTEPLKDMATSGKHLLRLINNVLDLAKIEAGRMELALGDYSVQDTVAGVHATLRPLAAEKGLEFATEVPAEIPIAHGDGGRITQCLMNLAGNSLKFTKSGRVAISVQQENGLLRYSVTDTGIGIPADKMASLFTEFKQTDATIASEFGGTGLGLSITKKFIEMHGGRIWVESEPGKGSAFIFEVPLRVSEVPLRVSA